MVSGAGVGYPDWQRYSNWVGPPLVTQAAFNVLPATQTFGPFNVSQWESLLFSFNNGAHPLRVVIDSTARLCPFATQQTFVIRANVQTQFVLPNRSDQVKVIISSALASAPSPDVVDMQINPCNLPEGVHATTDLGGALLHARQNVGAGATVSFSLPFYFGPAFIYVGQVAETANWSLITNDDAGVLQEQVVMPVAALAADFRPIVLPGLDNQITFFNGGGAAHQLNLLLVAEQP